MKYLKYMDESEFLQRFLDKHLLLCPNAIKNMSFLLDLYTMLIVFRNAPYALFQNGITEKLFVMEDVMFVSFNTDESDVPQVIFTR